MRIRTALCIVAAATLISLSAAADEGAEDDPVHRAQQALHSANFEQLVPLLESTVTDEDAAPLAHLLFALGLYYETSGEGHDASDAPIDAHIEKALQGEPDLDLDPMVYPPRFISRVQTVREDAGAAHVDGPDKAQIFYFERRIETRSRLPLFLPGGAGQFYNGAVFRGLTFALLQTLGIAANALAYWKIESMRTSAGQIEADQMSRARGWRNAQLAGLGTFFGGWMAGIIEANLNFERQTIRVRTLDAPPPELDRFDDELGLDTSLQLRWSATF